MSTKRVAAIALVAIIAVGIALFAWRATRSPPPEERAADEPIVLEPLAAPSDIVSLAVAGTDGARVSVPLGATEPRPIVIVLHAEAESADQQCKIWRGITGARPFVLCPQLGSGPTEQQVEAQLRGALRELKREFGDHVGKGSVILAGFGSGADHAVVVARQEPAFFSRLVLVDAGHASFSASNAGAFKQRGGQRLLFACSNEPCRTAVEAKLPVLRSQNLAVELLHAGDLPGALDPRLVKLMTERFSWLVANDQPKRVPNPRGVVAE